MKGIASMCPNCTTKSCSKCGETKPATTEYFRRDSRGYTDGFRNPCNACAKEVRRAWYEANRNDLIAKAAEWNRANNDRVAELARIRRATDNENFRAYRRSHYAINRERLTEYRRLQNVIHKDDISIRSRAYYAVNKEKIKNQIRSYQMKNRDKVRKWARVVSRNYRTRKLNAEGTHTAEDIQRQYKAQKGKCHYCKCKVGDKFHVDHVIPLSRGGSNWPENLVISCPPCNQSKGDKLPHEWLQGGRLL
jgi:5-methylcytosine-specific restriction endonuclease McrA